jgi:hypothetical protein
VGDLILGSECKFGEHSPAGQGDFSCGLVYLVGEWGCLVGDVGSLVGDKGCLT